MTPMRTGFNIAGFAFAIAAVLMTLPGAAPSAAVAESGKTSRLVRTSAVAPALAMPADDLAAAIDRAGPGAG